MRRGQIAAALGFALVLILMPMITDAAGMPSLLSLATRALIYGIAAASLNLVLGYGGMVSFGHAAFFGIGGYVVGILFQNFTDETRFMGLIPGSNQMLITLPMAILVAGLLAALIGALALRTGGVQFIMITMAFAQMLFFLFVSLKVYGGEDGLMIRRTNEVPFLDMRDKATLYWVVLAVTFGFVLALRQVVNSSFGAILAGIRQNERRMAALGISVFRYKLYAFVLSGMGAGLAGALMANAMRFASPDMMHWMKSGELMVMVILGGVGTLLGPFFGAATLLVLESSLSAWTEHWQLALGVILLVIVLGTKGGLAGLLAKIWGRK